MKENKAHFVWLMLGVLVLWLITVGIFKGVGSTNTYDGVTSVFTAFALAGVVYSLIQQSRIVTNERFESKFFEMLKAQREIVNEWI